MSNSFQGVLGQIRAIADSEAHKGRLFERLIKTYFLQDPLYQNRFTEVWLWTEWAATRPDFDGADTGIDLVAQEGEDRYCAIQCKCYAQGTRISKPHLDSFISASARDPFTARIVVDTGDEWGPNARKIIEKVKPDCHVLRFGDLAERPFDWPDLGREDPEALSLRRELFHLRPHQQVAFDEVMAGFQEQDRGKLIMACGTGKTFAALRIAEAVSGLDGRVLFLVPSISLFQQAMREWAEQKVLPHRYIGICSDTRAGRNDEDASLQELEIPVTTDPEAISRALREAAPEAMTVVFCTYHSLALVESAQDSGAPAFDLVLCDEAHRTTGIDRPEDDTSPFVLVHDAQRIRANKRLYMTATPRLYTEGAKSKAANHEIEVFSMDDPATYGPEFHRLPFSQAVEQDLLSDYKVVVFAMSEKQVDAALQVHLASGDSEINITDAAKIIGCWQALQNPEHKRPGEGVVRPLRRVIAFTNRIIDSKNLETYWDTIVTQAIDLLPEAQQPRALRCETRHVDGQHHALDRKARIEWLKGDADNTCRILSNARCLSEGIDVPALDAVLFLSSRKSHVDIVQSVGRAMRKSPGKEYGYIILPIAIPAGIDPAAALNDNERFATVWSVLRALRSHDDRFDAEINQIDLNSKPTDRIIFSHADESGISEKAAPHTLDLFGPLELPPGAIFAKIVEKCGDRKYWENWAGDVADIFSRLVMRIEGLLDNPENDALQEWFEAFHEELRVSINESITRASAIDMMSQHILTRPVFEALFEQYDFSGNNPVAQALDSLRKDFGEFGLENETRDLEPFYESVRQRARGLDNSAARQRVLMELYEKFFARAMKKEADRLGIVYTPVEIVDFILASANQVLREEFGRSLSDEGVHVLDPFTGTGIFLVRLLHSQLIRDEDLERKYRQELHANEIILLAYYIAAIHIEEAFHGRRGADSSYEPFGGIVLTDTFNLHTQRTGFPNEWLPDNSARAERQQKLPIQVIVGNPPWSVGQRSSADDNPNVNYPELEQRIAVTYAAQSTATNRNSLYNSYKMAIRWASDRVGEQGIIALVTSGTWIYGNVDTGVRACLAEEFSSVYVLNLRGNQRTQGELSLREGGKIFGQGSREPVAITILVRNPQAGHEGCRIRYRDIGDYLKREEKLAILREAGSIAGIKDWRTVTPDRHNDWISHRSEAFQEFYPMGSKDSKAGRADDTIFKLFSNGYKTGRDAYIYNFSHDACADNARKMVEDYQGALLELMEGGSESLDLENITDRYKSNFRWDREAKNNLRRLKEVSYSSDWIWTTQYRPYVKQHCYVEYLLVSNKYKMDGIFPAADTINRAICVPGVGSTKPFSVLIVDTMPDLHLVAFGQCFPRYRYEQQDDKQGDFLDDSPELQRIDNISELALRAFQTHYQDNTITRDSIFDYVYGILHAPDYQEQFANDLSKLIPRVPMAPDFHLFAKAGKELAELHLSYETCPEYPLDVVAEHGKPKPEHYRIGQRKMRFADTERTVLIVNEHIRLGEIPHEAHQYEVNGRTPLGWFIDRYRVTRDTQSGILNDPNGWFNDPKDLITAIRRIVHLSVETTRIVAGLPVPFEPDAESEKP
ncbi:MAG: DEAD/DEAH box helicase family protein [Halieaceae bacterium]|nr:DEAD/DEAH box helicase family protein [Halieaceae bacterium]